MREVKTVRIFREHAPSISLLWVFLHSFSCEVEYGNATTSCPRDKSRLGYCLIQFPGKGSMIDSESDARILSNVATARLREIQNQTWQPRT